MNNFIITTNVKTSQHLIDTANNLAKKFGVKVVPRQKKTIKELITCYEKILVVYKDKYVYYEKDVKLFFHPDTAMFRIKNNNDVLCEILKDCTSVFDATLGLGRDSIVLSYNDKKVVACESSEIIYFITSTGLKNYKTENEKLNSAMKKITCYKENSLDFLKKMPDNSFDAVYFDPMFQENIKESENLTALKKVADNNYLTTELLDQAKRVAKKKIVLKAHFKDSTFEKFNFWRRVRENTKFHYGIIDLEK